MCGIVGYLGKGDAYPALIKGLKRLEYRGYDSAGVALIGNDGSLNVYKAKGKVADLEAFCSDKDISGHVGIAHTRWATHGEPSAVNAHPHYSSSKNLAMIHNGIIENYADIKKNLIAKGVEFKSETDTEVLVQLIEYIQIKKNLDLLTAVQVALRQVIGAYAIAILDKRNPNQIIAARKQSPLVVGIGKDGEFYLGSDASPIIEYTDKVVYLEDGNIAVMRLGEELQVVNIQNVKLNPEVQTVDIDLGQIEKGGFPHFMLKEIFEQPECLRNCMRGRVVSRTVETRVMTDGDDTTSKKETEMGVVLSSITDHRQQLLNAKRIIIVACGTSWHAGLIGKQMIEKRSIHFVLGADYTFKMADRPFKFTVEAYYKALSHLIPYTVDNVRVVYYGRNESSGYATGIDFKLYGEFVPGTDSWLTFSLMRTKEKIDGLWIPRPTDQLYNVSLYFTDYFPNTTRWRFTLKAAFADGLPFGPPRSEKAKQTLRAPAYKRVDIGMSYRLLKNDDHHIQHGIGRWFKNIWLGIDCFNLLGIDNVNSYYWVTDITNTQYAVPNYLTGRQLNARISFDF